MMLATMLALIMSTHALQMGILAPTSRAIIMDRHVFGLDRRHSPAGADLPKSCSAHPKPWCMLLLTTLANLLMPP